METTQLTKQSFAPLINASSKVLILGTLPGEDSLKYHQYYGHKRNQFWQIIGELVQENLTELNYVDRCCRLLQHGLALWDTLKRAERRGSLDNNIRQPEYNDIPALLRTYPNIKTIAFNGRQAGVFFKIHHNSLPKNIKLKYLPSSSPAYTLTFANKLVLWQEALAGSV